MSERASKRKRGKARKSESVQERVKGSRRERVLESESVRE